MRYPRLNLDRRFPVSSREFMRYINHRVYNYIGMATRCYLLGNQRYMMIIVRRLQTLQHCGIYCNSHLNYQREMILSSSRDLKLLIFNFTRRQRLKSREYFDHSFRYILENKGPISYNAGEGDCLLSPEDSNKYYFHESKLKLWGN